MIETLIGLKAWVGSGKMHTRHDLLAARLATVRRDLQENLDRMTDVALDSAQSAGIRTLSGQLVEIIGTEIQLITLLRDD